MLLHVSFQTLRTALSKPSTSIQLCIVGLAAGLIAAIVIIVFRLCLILLNSQLIPEGREYSALPSWQLFLLPLIAVLLIIIIAKFTGFRHYRLGIPFVIHRFKLHYGHIPLGTSINQFFGGLLALASGFVVGKEGPTVHLAAAASHYIGRWCRLPFNSLRILAGCGIAAGIAAAFNTPFAAVIFVMEIVIRDYKIHIFIPVMLAAACGSVLTRLVFGDVAELSFLNFQSMNYWHLPLLVLLGICLGLLAAMFNQQLMWLMRVFRPFGMIARLLIAALITGTVGYFMPQALGAEFGHIHNFIDSSPTIYAILFLLLAKFLLATVAIALGIPGGIIGAVMVIGMLIGMVFLQAMLVIDASVFGNSATNQTSLLTNYALLGLAGFLAAVLSAPLAALSAVMELSSTQQVILPAIITIVSAYVTTRQLCRNDSIFIQQLDYQSLPYRTNAIREDLQETGVLALINTKFYSYYDKSEEYLHQSLKEKSGAIAINYYSEDVNEAEQVKYKQGWYLVGLRMQADQAKTPITLEPLDTLSEQHTLAEAYELLYKKRKGGIAIIKHQRHDKVSATTEITRFSHKNDLGTHPEVCGIITWTMLHTYLFRQQH